MASWPASCGRSPVTTSGPHETSAACSTGRARQPRPDPDGLDQGQAFPDGKVYLSFPGLGDRLAARVAGEIGDHPNQYESPNALACYAGKAPVTRRSGKSELVVACRLACNRY